MGKWASVSPPPPQSNFLPAQWNLDVDPPPGLPGRREGMKADDMAGGPLLHMLFKAYANTHSKLHSPQEPVFAAVSRFTWMSYMPFQRERARVVALAWHAPDGSACRAMGTKDSRTLTVQLHKGPTMGPNGCAPQLCALLSFFLFTRAL